MAEGAQRERWARESAMLAMLVNCHRDPKRGRPVTPADFDPFADRGGAHMELNRGTAKTVRKAMGL